MSLDSGDDRGGSAAMANGQLHRFTTTRLRPGYTKAEVDAFVERIEGTLGRTLPPDQQVTAQEIRDVIFTTTRLGVGYDEREVDSALDRYEAELAAREA
jgi:DivIVA domain-containing protein